MAEGEGCEGNLTVSSNLCHTIDSCEVPPLSSLETVIPLTVSNN